jgi:PAS domain S-box-containing protein
MAAQSTLRVLNLEDNKNDSELILAELQTEWNKVELLRVETRSDFVRALEQFKPDIVLSDFQLPGFDGSEAQLLVRKHYPKIPVIIVTGVLADIEAVNLLKQGARDYVMKNHLARLTSAVKNALSLEQGIRARKNAEQALKQSEADLRALVENSPVAMIVDTGTGAAEKIVAMNQKFTALFGYTIEDIPDIHHWWRLAYPDEEYRKNLMADWQRQAEHAIENHSSVEPREVEVSCKDGSRRYVRVSFVSTGSRNIVTFEDLTKRRQAETRLRESEEKLRSIFEGTLDGIVLADAETRMLANGNQTAYQMLGYSEEEFSRLSIEDIHPPQDRSRVMAQFEKLLKKEIELAPDIPVLRKNGSVFYADIKGSPVSFGGKIYLVGLFRDITERKRTEARIQRLNQINAALSQCNQAIVRSQNDQQLFQQICNGAVQFGGFKMSWIGLLDPSSRMITPVASSGQGAQEYLHDIRISADAESEYGAGPTGTCIRTNQPYWCQNFLQSALTAPWHERARILGWRSSASIPLRRENKVIGAFMLYADEPDAFDESARELLIEMADNINYALDNLSHEAQRKLAEAKTASDAMRFEGLFKLNEMGGLLPEQDFLRLGLEWVEKLTGSKIAFIHFVNADQKTIELVTWSSSTTAKFCTATFDRHYPVANAGIWADCLRQRQPVIFNDYANYSGKRGLPQGHSPLVRLISVPVIEEGLVRVILGVGNKESDYTAEDVEVAHLFGNDMWRIIRRQRLETELAENLASTTDLNKELKQSNEELKAAQHQLLQSEKMASIGLLAAGVAHEINNPVGYVNSNLGTLEKYLADIFVVLDKYEAAEALNSCDNPLLEELRKFKEKINLNYIREDTRALITESHQGLDRVKKIILDLKDFSRSNAEENWGWANVQQGLESTLNVVWNELKYKCEVIKEFAPLPQIYCLPSQLNQVFMNLLVNAAQAIEVRGKITVRTGTQDEQIWVEVSDTGKGIPPEIIPLIFNPFFTTKPIGKGTGLGLSVSYKIVEKHHGKIEVHSEVGVGTTFRVWLPIQQAEMKA